jgi:Flp pilus assembly protein TadD
MLAIFDAALANPTIPSVAQASVYHALRAYHHRVLGDAEAALRYAELAVQAAPSEWEMQDRKIRLLATLGRFDEAEQALREAVVSDTAGVRGARAERLAAVIERARRGEPVPAAPRDETANGAAR